MVYKYKKPYRVKRKKPILTKRFLGWSLSALVFFGMAFYFLFPSDFFKIKKITIRDQQRIYEENIMPLIPIVNIFLVDTQRIENDALRSFPSLAEIKIRRNLPDSLSIILTEREAVAIWCGEADKNCSLVDEKGAVFGKASLDSDLVKIFGERELLTEEKIDQFLGIRSKLEGKLDTGTTKAFFASDERLNLETAEGWQVYLNLKGDLDWQIEELALVLEKQIPQEKRKNLEYIDLRFSRVYYRFTK